MCHLRMQWTCIESELIDFYLSVIIYIHECPSYQGTVNVKDRNSAMRHSRGRVEAE